jgi:hypothetical protein
LSKPNADILDKRFQLRLNELKTNEAEPLTSYLYLNQPLELRTTHVFAMLTISRWWHLNFDSAGSSQ